MTEALQAVIRAARERDGPDIPDAASLPGLGGVDPLGLRQLNFDLMDRLLPGLNNVAGRVRPFVLVAWAARRSGRLCIDKGGAAADMRDFLDRIEVLYAWSQFLIRPDAELPGRQVLEPLMRADAYMFGGEEWEARRKTRRASTALIAALYYGPGLKAFQWARPIPEHPEAWQASPRLDEALDAFEAGLGGELAHPAFSAFGTVIVTAEEARRWGPLWAMDTPSEPEKAAFREVLTGDGADPRRRAAFALILAEAGAAPEAPAADLRDRLSRPAASGEAMAQTRAAWRRLQVRQAFRLALEAGFAWCLSQLDDRPRTTADLVAAFRALAGGWAAGDEPGSWLDAGAASASPVALIDRLVEALRGDLDDLPPLIAEAISLCLADTASDAAPAEGRADRLPLTRALAEARAWRTQTPEAFLAHVIETWLFAQHAYWSAARGLTDARVRGKVLLRLRVTLDDGGWRLTRLGEIGGRPAPTPDRLETAISLARDCGLLAP